MGPSRAERLRERWILSHILIISLLLVIGLWGFFGVIGPPWGAEYWCRRYWGSWEEAEKYRALERLFDDTSPPVERTFFDAAQNGRSDRIRSIGDRWYEHHRKTPLTE